MTTDAQLSGFALCDEVLNRVGSRSEATVSISEGVSALTRFANSSIHQNHAEDTRRVSLRVVVEGGRAASMSTSRTDSEALARLVEDALAAAALRPPDPHWPGLAPPAQAPAVEHYDDATAQADPLARAGVVKGFCDAGPGLDGAGFCSTSGTVRFFANSAGQRLTGRSTAAALSGIHQTPVSAGNGRQGSSRLQDLDGASIGAIAAEKARASEDAADIEPGRYEVVLEPSCVANMLQFLASSGFNAKAHADALSFVHIGNRQMDDSVSIWDDATDPRTVGIPFDGEGTPKERLDLVRDGVSVAVAHDRRSAALAGVQSTGHGSGSAAGGPVPGNLFFGAGTSSRDELISQVERGLLVSDFNYTRILDPKTQVVTGLTRNSTFLIENGKVRTAVRNLRFTQSYVGALAPGNVLGIGNDARLIGSSFVPTLHLGSWNFTGGARG